jgi:hypothetical protein
MTPITNEEFMALLQSAIWDADKRKESAKALCDACGDVRERLLIMSMCSDAIQQMEYEL